MFLEMLIQHEVEDTEQELPAFISRIGELNNRFRFHVGTMELAGERSTFVDFYPETRLEHYNTFGGIFVRVWAVGHAARLLYGIYLGSKRSSAQEEIRRGVQYARERMLPVINPLEEGEGFVYRQWTDSQIAWLSTGSKRAVSRQFDLFITSKEATDDFDAEDAVEVDLIEDEVRQLIHAVDRAVRLLSPLREFAKEVVLNFFVPPSDLPPEDELLPAQISVDWSRGESASPAANCGLVGLEGVLSQILAALRSGKHVVLIGPPGTGKTELAICVCRTLGVLFDLVTATSEWTTFDTIGGYLPDPGLRDGGNIEPLNFYPAIVTQSLERAHWLIIDELNRADIDKSFGELFTLLSGQSVRLPFKKREGSEMRSVVLGDPGENAENTYVIPVPRNWRILGTMNTFDKASLYQLSYAFMRRFAFIEVPIPSVDDYETIIDEAARRFDLLPEARELREYCLDLLKAVFTPDPGEHLAALGLLVGPAIPIDIIKYLSHRIPVHPAAPSRELLDSVVLEALEMYLYPQFEGKDQKHAQVVEALTAALGLSVEAQLTTSRALATWTGVEEFRGDDEDSGNEG